MVGRENVAAEAVRAVVEFSGALEEDDEVTLVDDDRVVPAPTVSVACQRFFTEVGDCGRWLFVTAVSAVALVERRGGQRVHH